MFDRTMSFEFAVALCYLIAGISLKSTPVGFSLLVVSGVIFGASVLWRSKSLVARVKDGASTSPLRYRQESK